MGRLKAKDPKVKIHARLRTSRLDYLNKRLKKDKRTIADFVDIAIDVIYPISK